MSSGRYWTHPGWSGTRQAAGLRTGYGTARRGPDRALPAPPTGCPSHAGGLAGTPTPSGGCASGWSPRSSRRSPARTSPSPTCRRSSTRLLLPARASVCIGVCPPWSPRASTAATWLTLGCGKCTGRPPAGPCPRRTPYVQRIGAVGARARFRPTPMSPSSPRGGEVCGRVRPPCRRGFRMFR
jgi:hypothetical protein